MFTSDIIMYAKELANIMMLTYLVGHIWEAY